MKNFVEFNVVKNNGIAKSDIDSSRVAGFTVYSPYTTLLTLDNLDTGESMVIAEPYDVVKSKIDKALDIEKDK